MIGTHDYPGQRPFQGWFLQDQAIAASATITGPVFDLHRGVGPSDADGAGNGHTTIRSGVLIGERIILAMHEDSGTLAAPLDIEIFGGCEEGSLRQLVDVGQVAQGGVAQFDFAFGWPWMRIDIESTDGLNAGQFTLALHIIPS